MKSIIFRGKKMVHIVHRIGMYEGIHSILEALRIFIFDEAILFSGRKYHISNWKLFEIHNFFNFH